MGSSLQLGSIAGIRIQMHWTFLLIIGWVVLISLLTGISPLGIATNVAFVLVLFGCVLLHELGHALAARSFGITTRDITLLPIGALARLERMPKKPIQELFVALAGPAVNVAIAGILLAILLPTVGINGLAAFPMQSGGFLQQLLIVNVILVVFNMLPAFPLDGGRVFRALLAMVFTYATATRIAATVGQVCAIGLGFLGLANPFMLIIAAFIFFGAAAEARQATVEAEFGGFRVGDGMVRAFRALPVNSRVRDWAEEFLDGSQRVYPVIDNELFVGMLRQDALLEALSRENDVLVGDIMDRGASSVEESDGLVSALQKVTPTSGATLPVTNRGLLVGLLDLQQMFDLAKARTAVRRLAAFTPTTLSAQRATSLN